MKKIILIVALVVAYGVSISNAATKINVEKSQITVVADDNNPTTDGKDGKATVEEKAADDKACCKTAKKDCSSSCSKTAKKECSDKSESKSCCSKSKEQASK